MAFLAAAAPFLSLAGTAIGAVGQFASGMYSAQVAENNRQIAEQNAQYALQAGQVKAGDYGIKAGQRRAEIKTATAANGIDVNSGSATEVQASQAMVDQLDVERILHDANLTAYGYRTQGMNYQAQADQDRLSGVFGGVSTLLDGASQFGGSIGKKSSKANLLSFIPGVGTYG